MSGPELLLVDQAVGQRPEVVRHLVLVRAHPGQQLALQPGQPGDYFRTKEDLYAALFDSARDAVVSSGVKNASEAESLPDRLGAFLEAATQVDAGDRSYARFIAASLLDAFRHPELRERAVSQLDDVRAFLESTLQAAVDDGSVRADLDVPAVTEMLLAVMWGMGLYAGFVGTHEQLEAVVDQFSRLLEGRMW